jgi:ABC-2 type transport system permease protein
MSRAFRALVFKDIRIFLADPRAVIFSVLAPILIAAFFGYIFSGEGTEEMGRVPVVVVDNDKSRITTDLSARLAANEALEVKGAGAGAVREAVRRGDAAVAVEFPAGFGAAAAGAFFAGGQQEKARLVLLYDPTRSTEAAMVEGILAGHVMEAVSKEMFTGPTGMTAVNDALAELQGAEDMPAAEKDALRKLLEGVAGWNELSAGAGTATQAQGGLTIPYEVTKQAVTSREGVEYNAYAHSFAGMGVQFILFLGIEMGVGLLLLRQQGLWRRLRAAPLSRATLLGSRAASTALLSLFILGCLYLVAWLVFGVRIEGSLAGFLGVCAGFSLMTAAFGLVLAGFGKTPDGTRGLAIVATLFLVMLGGAWVPTFVFPAWLQRLTVFVPTRWAVDGLDATTWRGLEFSSVAWPIALLFGTALVFGGLAVARFRWEE